MARRRNPRLVKVKQTIFALVVLGVLIGSGWFVFNRLKTEKPKPAANSVDIAWQFDGRVWRPSGTPPACEEPLLEASPVDTSLVTAVLYPGQFRGGDYKAHGGFRFDKARSSDITVRMPKDARLTGLTQYIESDEIQYMLTFTNPCGIMYRFDHLRTLSSRLQSMANALPPPQINDTRSLPVTDGPKFAVGEVVATAVGSPKNKNIGMDFGVYDLRNTNDISKNPAWAALHADKAEQTYYGICWLGLLPVTDASRMAALVAADDPKRTVSDYCLTPGGRTL